MMEDKHIDELIFGLDNRARGELIQSGWMLMCNIAPLKGLAKVAVDSCVLKGMRREGNKDIISLAAFKKDEHLFNKTILDAIGAAFGDVSGKITEMTIDFVDTDGIDGSDSSRRDTTEALK